MSKNRVIGVDNRLPWRIPEDLKRFKEVTWGHPVIMGRKTFESIGKPLPGRKNIVISRQKDFVAQGSQTVSSLEEALDFVSKESPSEVFIIGGAQIYQLALSKAQKLYLTIVEQEVHGDAYFPEFDWQGYKETYLEKKSAPVNFRFLILEKL